MKIRNHKKQEYWFRPHENSSLKLLTLPFKRKSDLMKFLNNNFNECVNGVVSINVESFTSSYTLREYFVWYNEKECRCGAKPKIVLKQLDFRGRKYIRKQFKISKASKKYFAFSDKVIRLMCSIEDDNGVILPDDAERLYTLFKKRGFVDFEPTEGEWEYINGHIGSGIDFYHWSDRCDFLRTKTIVEYFKQKNLLK